MVSAQSAGAQVETVFHVHKTGDTLSVPNAVVTIDHIIEAGKTDAHGNVRVSDLEDGGHIVEISAPGYQYIFDQFDSGPTIRQPIELDVAPDTKQQNMAKGPSTGLRLADFESRRAKGAGAFLTRAQLEKATGRPMANVLTIDLGASTVTEHGDEFVVSSDPSTGSTPCYAAVIRDGFIAYPVGSAGPPDFGKVFAEQFEAAELYKRPALVPPELRAVAKCGALVVWSRAK
jgi:hypothetical protein